MGREFGATTGRPRRCGWFDSVATRHATMVNGIDDLAVTNLDGLDTVETIKVCVAYRHGKTQYDFVPNDAQVLAECEPVYVEFEGWRTPTDKARSWKQLPAKARTYLKAIAELSNAKLFIASVGPAREPDDFCLMLCLLHRTNPPEIIDCRIGCVGDDQHTSDGSLVRDQWYPIRIGQTAGAFKCIICASTARIGQSDVSVLQRFYSDQIVSWKAYNYRTGVRAYYAGRGGKPVELLNLPAQTLTQALSWTL